MANRYYVGTGTLGSPTNWNSTSRWSTTSGGASGASVPGTSDTAIFDLHSGYCTTDVNISIAAMTVGNTLSAYSGALIIGTGFSLTVSGALQGLTSGASAVGEINLNGQTCSFGSVTFSATNCAFFVAGAATISLTGTGNFLWLTSSGAPPSIALASFIVTNTSASPKNLSFSTQMGSLTVTRGGTGEVTVHAASGNYTITNLTTTGSGPLTLGFLNGHTMTTSNFNVNGDATNPVVIKSSTSGSAATISCAKPVYCQHVSLQDITATGNTPFLYDQYSSVVSNVHGWAPKVIKNSGILPLVLS